MECLLKSGGRTAVLRENESDRFVSFSGTIHITTSSQYFTMSSNTVYVRAESGVIFVVHKSSSTLSPL